MKTSPANIPVVCRQVSSPPLHYSKLYVKWLHNLAEIRFWHTYFVTVQTGASHSSFIRQQIIHLREKNIVGPTERSGRLQAAFISRFTLDDGRAPKCLPFVPARIRHLGLSPTQAHRVGPTFFDEDDVCGRIPELSYRPSELLFTSNPNSSGLNLGHTLSWVTITDAASRVPISHDSARLFP